MSELQRMIETMSPSQRFVCFYLQHTEPMTGTLWDITHNIALTDDELAEREDWITYVASLDPEDETFEADLYNWEESG